jgi:phospholipase C
MFLRSLCFLELVVAAFAAAAKSEPKKPQPGLDQIQHVVFFMQENRAFDHYFGSLAGVRGFKDPNVQVNPDDAKQGLLNVFYQSVTRVFRYCYHCG